MARLLFAASALQPRGSIRFELGRGSAKGHSMLGEGPAEGFALRTDAGQVCAWVNECPHRSQPVDLGDGKLFRRNGTIECQAHGAFFQPDTGLCVEGPCRGESLQPLPIREQDGFVWLLAEPALPAEEPPEDDREADIDGE